MPAAWGHTYGVDPVDERLDGGWEIVRFSHHRHPLGRIYARSMRPYHPWYVRLPSLSGFPLRIGWVISASNRLPAANEGMLDLS